MDTEGNGLDESSDAGQLPGKALRPTRSADPAAQVRGVPAERVIRSVEADPFLDLRALAEYSHLSIRTLARHLGDPGHGLPHFKVGGKILVRRSEFDRWMEGFRRRIDVSPIVNDVLERFRT